MLEAGLGHRPTLRHAMGKWPSTFAKCKYEALSGSQAIFSIALRWSVVGWLVGWWVGWLCGCMARWLVVRKSNNAIRLIIAARYCCNCGHWAVGHCLGTQNVLIKLFI